MTKAEWQVRDMEVTLQRLRDENKQLRAALAHALYAIDMIMTAQQPLADSWFAERDACIKVAREALQQTTPPVARTGWSVCGMATTTLLSPTE